MPQKGTVDHDSQDVRCRFPVGAVAAGTRIRLAIRLNFEEEVAKVSLRLWSDRLGETLLDMLPNADSAKGNRVYSVMFTVPETGCLLWYYFIVRAYHQTFYYGNNAQQIGGHGACYSQPPPSFQITVHDVGAHTPNWFKRAVMYQIFPDRFYRAGNEIRRKKGAVYHACWQDPPFYYKDVETKEIVAYDFFGGNLAGIQEKLPELQALGISVIYLNPVFESPSNHHYDTGDYHKIDPILGTNEDLQSLCEAGKKRGIRILLDGVFSHTGSDSRYFNREGNYDTVGAYQSQQSPYYAWYDFHKYPDDYDSWWGFWTLPNVHETTPSYMDFIIYHPESVLHQWMAAGISGWRLDVIDELPAKFTQSFYQEMKRTMPESVLIGEVWEDASNKVSYGVPREYLCGREIDGAMNYPFRKLVLDFLLGHMDAAEMSSRLLSLKENYPVENFYAMMNLLGSHDVERLLTLLGEAPSAQGMTAVQQGRYRLPQAKRKLGMDRMKLAVLWQMTFPGVPSIYYGDEIGMEGFRDPNNRGAYDWEHGDQNLRSWYKEVIAIRQKYPALSTGEFFPVYADGDVYGYVRRVQAQKDVFQMEADSGVFLILLNRHPTKTQQVTFSAADFSLESFRDLLGKGPSLQVCQGTLSVSMPPLTGYLYQEEKPAARFPRMAGILLHPTSLPSKYGIGDFGPEAYAFVDFLVAAGQKIWQILPLHPVGFGFSPYQSPSAFAGNPLLISPDGLIEAGWLHAQEAKVPFADTGGTIDFSYVQSFKQKCLKRAFSHFQQQALPEDYQIFCQEEAFWLEDYALFAALKTTFGEKAWTNWPEKLRNREAGTLAAYRQQLQEEIFYEKFVQYVFFRQWKKLHAYASEKGIQILGDLPLFLSHDSADVWMHPQLFDLDASGQPKSVAGVPPDYFSKTGQLWGNPQYRWEAMEKEDYAWWKMRLKHLFSLVDQVRIDHFRGLEAFWRIDGRAKTAADGEWVKGLGEKFLASLRAYFGKLPVVAEDLGVLTDKVEALRNAFGLPGMKVLQFEIPGNRGKRLGFLSAENSILYTGTHDNNTTVGWYTEDLSESDRAAVAALLSADMNKPSEVCQRLLMYAYAAQARTVILPMQDVLALGSSCRMNAPGTVGRNWGWRLKPAMLSPKLAEMLHTWCEEYQR